MRSEPTSGVGTTRTSSHVCYPVANRGKADMAFARADFRF